MEAMYLPTTMPMSTAPIKEMRGPVNPSIGFSPGWGWTLFMRRKTGMHRGIKAAGHGAGDAAGGVSERGLREGSV